MKKIILILQVFSLLFRCYAQKSTNNESAFNSITVDTILNPELSIRAIDMNGSKVWYAADKGKFGFYDLVTHHYYESKISNGSADFEFRSIAVTSSAVFVINVGNPAFLYRIAHDGKNVKLVYEEHHEKVFYDSMRFWNEKEGIAVGDPTNDCLSIITTSDGGNSWRKIPCSGLPKVKEGEAAFAASNTNITIKGNKTWVVSGGKKSRVFYSPDKAKSWEVFETPIVQGLAMTGIFTCDFYNDRLGFIAGGNYEMPQQNSRNKAITTNGGKNWKLVAENEGFGYASCVQFVPERHGKQLVSVGASGVQCSNDSGRTWKKLLDTKNLFTIRFVNPSTAIAAGWNCMLLLHFK